MVTWSAIPRVTGFIVLDISQRTSSASTAASEIVVEKVKAEKRLMGGVEDGCENLEDGAPRKLKGEEGFELRWPSLSDWSPERSGNSLWKTIVAMKRKETRKGRAENMTEIEGGDLRRMYSGMQSSQSSVGRTMGAEQVWNK